MPGITFNMIDPPARPLAGDDATAGAVSGVLAGNTTATMYPAYLIKPRREHTLTPPARSPPVITRTSSPIRLPCTDAASAVPVLGIGRRWCHATFERPLGACPRPGTCFGSPTAGTRARYIIKGVDRDVASNAKVDFYEDPSRKASCRPWGADRMALDARQTPTPRPGSRRERGEIRRVPVWASRKRGRHRVQPTVSAASRFRSSAGPFASPTILIQLLTCSISTVT